MEKARNNTELYSNLSEPLNNVKPSNFWGSHHLGTALLFICCHNKIVHYCNDWPCCIHCNRCSHRIFPYSLCPCGSSEQAPLRRQLQSYIQQSPPSRITYIYYMRQKRPAMLLSSCKQKRMRPISSCRIHLQLQPVWLYKGSRAGQIP